ncbi:MFS transporter [Streptomyces canus]|uniref:MFS transporter n=1 Tax=Streptomyces canus TaxID=58343 RepID=UPI003718951B
MSRAPGQKDDSGLLGVFVALAVQNGATNLISVFVPLLLMKNGAGFRGVCLFYVVYSLVKLAADYPCARLVVRAGARNSLLAGFVLSSLYVLLLNDRVAGASQWLSYLAAGLLACSNALVWTAQHMHISQALNLRRRGTDIVRMDFLARAGNLLAPVLGSAVVWLAGESTLLVTAAALCALSIVPMWSADRDRPPATAADIPRVRLSSAPPGDLAANMAFVAHSTVNLTVWPLYLAVVLGGFTEIGVLTTGAGLVSFLVVLVAGRRTDGGRSRRVLWEGSVLSSALHLLRPLATGPVSTALVTACSRTAGSYQRIAWTGIYYGHAQHKGKEYVSALELSGDVGGVLTWLTVLAVWAASASARSALSAVFILGALSAVGVMLVRREAEEHVGNIG